MTCPRDLELTEAANLLRQPAERADILRLELLHRHGGVYLDADFECLKPIDPLLDGVSCFLGLLDSGRVSNAVIGAVPGHPLLAQAMAEVRPRTTYGPVDREGTGPLLLERIRHDVDGRDALRAERLLRDRARAGRVRVPSLGAVVEGRGRAAQRPRPRRARPGDRRARSCGSSRSSYDARRAGRLAAADPQTAAATVTAVQIAGRELGPRVFVIAEIGNNHDGSIRQAERLIEAAAEAGADAVKFQTHIAEAEMLPSTPTPPHFDEPRWEFTKRMELSKDDHLRLKAFAEERGLVFFSSPFSVEAVELLEEVGVPAYKIASGEVTNPPLLEAIAATGQAGAALERDVRDGGRRARRRDPARRTAPSSSSCSARRTTRARPSSSTCARWRRWASASALPYGLSDHTPDIWTSIAAVALGAVAVEKHFTLSKRLYGPDHHASLDARGAGAARRGRPAGRGGDGRPA